MSLTIDAFTLGLLAAICLAIGFLVALLIANLRQQEGQTEETPAEEPDVLEGIEEVFRLFRGEDGGVVPRLGDRVIQDASDLNAEDHGLLSLGLVDLYAWLEAGHRPAPKVKTRRARPKKKAAEEQGEQPEPSESAELDVEEEASEEAETEEAAAARPAGLNPLKSLVRTAQSEINDKVPEESPSIASQVDEILQAHLEGTPLEDRAIRLLDLPNQGMVILVGLEKYQALDEVPDEEIRDVLKTAVAEWEASMLKASRRGALGRPDP